MIDKPIPIPHPGEHRYVVRVTDLPNGRQDTFSINALTILQAWEIAAAECVVSQCEYDHWESLCVAERIEVWDPHTGKGYVYSLGGEIEAVPWCRNAPYCSEPDDYSPTTHTWEQRGIYGGYPQLLMAHYKCTCGLEMEVTLSLRDLERNDTVRPYVSFSEPDWWDPDTYIEPLEEGYNVPYGYWND